MSTGAARLARARTAGRPSGACGSGGAQPRCKRFRQRMDPASVRTTIKRTATVAFTILGIALAAWVFVRAPLAVGVTVASLLIAVALDRPVQGLERRGVPRWLGITLVMLAVVGAIAGVALVLVPPAVAQVGQLVENAPTLVAKLRETAPFQFVQHHVPLGDIIANERSRFPSLARELVDPVLAFVRGILAGAAELVTVLFVVLFMLASGRQLVWAALAQARPENRARYASVLTQVYRSLGGYIGGMLLLVVTNALFAGAFLAVIRVPYFLPLAVMSGIASMIPYVGAVLVGTVLSAVAWVNNGMWTGVFTICYYIAYQQFENHVVGPLVYRRTVHLNPLVILIAALFMTELGGIPGALVAVPLAASVQIVLREILRARQERLNLPDVPPGPELMRTEGRPAPPAAADARH
jgi:predicted PurR-regulated permease PerM